MIFLIRKVLIRTDTPYDFLDTEVGYVEAPSLKDALEKLDLVKLGIKDTDEEDLYFPGSLIETITSNFSKDESRLVIGYLISVLLKELTKEDIVNG